MIEIGIIDDHAIVRSGLRQLFSTTVDMRVVVDAASGKELFEIITSRHVDVLLLDIMMPGQDGYQVLRALRQVAPSVAILIFSGYPEEHHAIEFLRQGADGYLNKNCDGLQVIDAIRTLKLTGRYITPRVADLLANQLERKQGALPHTELSEREREVFLMLARGSTVGDISREMELSEKTVSTYRARAMRKLSLKTNSDLTYYAVRHHLIE